MDTTIEGGFADLVLGAQYVFRAVMDALARPGIAQSIASDALPPAPLTPELVIDGSRTAPAEGARAILALLEKRAWV